jgi:23S rRNA G2069 N7-methylase RlmK/C1962 C5-methylase RlmI
LRLIDLCREVFDVVVMNPPFGALAANTKDQLVRAYPRSKNDLLAIMVERGLELLRVGGRLGAITSRACFFLPSYKSWREKVLMQSAPPAVMADLGLGVMDDAMVEAAAYVLEKIE